jgi:hypothetical protein
VGLHGPELRTRVRNESPKEAKPSTTRSVGLNPSLWVAFQKIYEARLLGLGWCQDLERHYYCSPNSGIKLPGREGQTQEGSRFENRLCTAGLSVLWSWTADSSRLTLPSDIYTGNNMFLEASVA